MIRRRVTYARVIVADRQIDDLLSLKGPPIGIFAVPLEWPCEWVPIPVGLGVSLSSDANYQRRGNAEGLGAGGGLALRRTVGPTDSSSRRQRGFACRGDSQIQAICCTPSGNAIASIVQLIWSAHKRRSFA